MSIVRASCPDCGDVELTIAEVRVVVCSTNNETAYAFNCPSCQRAVTKAADSRVVDVLVASGATLAVWSLPAELSEVHSGPPISYDDVLAFHFQLDDDDCLAELAERARELQGTGGQD